MYVETAGLLFCLNQKVFSLNYFFNVFTEIFLKVGTTAWISDFLHLSGTNFTNIKFKDGEDYSHKIHTYCEFQFISEEISL